MTILTIFYFGICSWMENLYNVLNPLPSGFKWRFSYRELKQLNIYINWQVTPLNLITEENKYVCKINKNQRPESPLAESTKTVNLHQLI